MIDKETARCSVQDHLAKQEVEVNSFGSALPGFADKPKLHLVILDEHTQEHDFGWVFFYNTQEYIDGDSSAALAGNAPLIVDKIDGLLYATGTAEPLEHYLDEYRAGRRSAAEQ